MWALNRGTVAKETWRKAVIGSALVAALDGCGFGDVYYDDAGAGAEVGATPGATGGSAGTSSVLGLPPCMAAPLSDRCRQDGCPATPELASSVCPPETPGAVSYRYGTLCGGTAIELDRGPSHVETWFYDADGALIGVTQTTEQGPSCQSLAGTAVTSAWGEVCSFALGRSNLCDPACPLDDCWPRADILGDFPLALDQLTGMQLHLCRGLQCLTAHIYEELQLGQNVPFYLGINVDGPYIPERATMWLGPGSADSLELHLTWILQGLEFPEQDLYLVSLDDPNSAGPPMAVFEALVDYQIADLGCAGSCRFADVDVRESATTEP